MFAKLTKIIFDIVKNAALKRFANYRKEYLDSLVFWAKEYFDRFDRSAFFAERFNSYYDSYQHHMENFEATLDERIRNRTITSLQLKDEFQRFFQAIQRIVQQIILIAEIPGIPRP